MTLTRHMLKKDFRYLRWMLIAWIALTIVDTLSRVMMPALTVGSERFGNAAPFWSLLLWLAYTMALFAFVSHQIQAEPLVGSTAFWLTRPVPRRALFQSKLLGLLLFIALPGLIAEGLLMAAFHVPAGSIVRSLMEQALSMLGLLLILAFASTVTSNLVRLLLLIIGTIIVLFVAALVASIVWQPTMDPNMMRPNVPQDPTAGLVGSVVLAIGVAFAIWRHYARRRRAVAIGLFLIAGAVSIAAEALWPGVSLFGGEPTLSGAWARDASISRLHLRADAGLPGRWVNETNAYNIGAGHTGERVMRQIAAPLVLDGLPAEYTISPFTMDARLQFEDGRVIRGNRSFPRNVTVSARTGAMLPVPYRGADAVRNEEWPVLMTAPADELSRAGTRAGHYAGTFECLVTKHDRLGVLPLTPGATVTDGPRSLAIANAIFRPNACAVTIRTTTVDTLADQLITPVLVTSFRQRGDGLPLRDQMAYTDGAYVGGIGSDGGGIGSMHAMFLLPMLRPARPMEIAYQIKRIFYPTSAAPIGSGPPCDQIELVVERTTYAGRLTRTVEIPDFRVDRADSLSPQP
jgi:hypothetical protein